MVNGFIYYLHTRLGTTSTYNAIADLHTLQITATPAKPFPDSCIFTSHSLATASINGDSSASRAEVPSSQPPLQNSTEFIALTFLVITSRHVPQRKHRSPTVAFVSVDAGTCLPSCCPETAAGRTT
jgi:hypothetical protein